MLNGLNVGPDWVVPNVDHYFNLSPMGSVVNLNGVANWSHLINSLRVFYRRGSAVTYIDSDARHRKGPRRRWLLGDVTVELFALEVPPNGVEGCLGTVEKMQVLISCDDIMFFFFIRVVSYLFKFKLTRQGGRVAHDDGVRDKDFQIL